MSRTFTLISAVAIGAAAVLTLEAHAAPSTNASAIAAQVKQARAEERELRQAKRAKRDAARIAQQQETLACLQSRIDALKADQKPPTCTTARASAKGAK